LAAYDRYIGRWSRLFVPAVLAAAEVAPGSRVLDVSTGTGEAALPALPITGRGGLVVGLDIAPAMLIGARQRLSDPSFCAVAADGQALPFDDASFDAVVCQLGLQFFPNPARGLTEFRRVLRDGRRAAVCVVSTPERAPMWGVLAAALARYLPAQQGLLHFDVRLGGGEPAATHVRFCRVPRRSGGAAATSGHDRQLRRILGSDRGWDGVDAAGL
jgi:ubiquinone/menaquinone biosynthesis C-methylase UbiE